MIDTLTTNEGNRGVYWQTGLNIVGCINEI